MDDKLLTISQAARRMGIHINTLRAWADKGRVPVVRTPTGQRRFRAEDIDEIRKPQPMYLAPRGEQDEPGV